MERSEQGGRCHSRQGLLLPLFLCLAYPRPVATQADWDPVVMCTYWVPHSDIMDEDRMLQVRLLRGYEESQLRYPVVCLFYSDWLELYYAEAVNILHQMEADLLSEVILVEVPNIDRYRNLYPWPRPDGWGGEAERFFRFVRAELLPFVDSEYRTKECRILVGHQAAATFGAYTPLGPRSSFGSSS